jgi:7-keto-8-aminopelargonate synthetase-like enzyme
VAAPATRTVAAACQQQACDLHGTDGIACFSDSYHVHDGTCSKLRMTTCAITVCVRSHHVAHQPRMLLPCLPLPAPCWAGTSAATLPAAAAAAAVQAVGGSSREQQERTKRWRQHSNSSSRSVIEARWVVQQAGCHAMHALMQCNCQSCWSEQHAAWHSCNQERAILCQATLKQATPRQLATPSV